MEGIEERMARIEGAFEGTREMLNHLEGDVRDLNNRVEHLSDRTERRFDEMNRNFRMLLWIVIIMWVTIIGAIFGAAALF